MTEIKFSFLIQFEGEAFWEIKSAFDILRCQVLNLEPVAMWLLIAH